MRDLMKALRSLALSESTITDLVETRVYVNKIPRAVIKAEDTEQPSKMLVLRQSGGAGKADILPVGNRSFDALCYGETDFEANRVLRAVAQRFIDLDREQIGDVLIHHINTTGGPIPSVEPDLVWPAVAMGFTTLADLLEVA